jgi:hypothetical protein
MAKLLCQRERGSHPLQRVMRDRFGALGAFANDGANERELARK